MKKRIEDKILKAINKKIKMSCHYTRYLKRDCKVCNIYSKKDLECPSVVIEELKNEILGMIGEKKL